MFLLTWIYRLIVLFSSDVLFRTAVNWWIPKTGDNKTIDARRIMPMPIIFIPNPTLIKSMILTFPLENIIALGGVARYKS
jgi:hypothetical protein